MSAVALPRYLIDLALAGNEEATECLYAAMPDPLPAAVVLKFRNAQILATANWLRGRVSNPTEHHLATIIAAAGAALQTRRTLVNVLEVGLLTSRQLGELAERIRPFLSSGSPWPAVRQVRRILCGELDIEGG